jgi:hypothetical protein
LAPDSKAVHTAAGLVTTLASSFKPPATAVPAAPASDLASDLNALAAEVASLPNFEVREPTSEVREAMPEATALGAPAEFCGQFSVAYLREFIGCTY